MINSQRFSRERPFLNFMERIHASIVEAKQPAYLLGFVVTRHPAWDRFRRMEREGWNILFPDHMWGRMPAISWNEEYFTSDDENDDSLQSKWKQFSPSKTPYLVKVCVGPTAPDTVQARRRLQSICAAETAFFAIVEDRAPARLASLEGGRHLTAGSHAGTIGGFLKDKSGGAIFGVTCGHVGQSTGNSASVQDVAGATVTIGAVVETNWPLTASSSTALCQPATAQNRLDMALIDLAGSHVPTKDVRGIGAITDIFPLAQLGSGHRVQMSGAVSGNYFYNITGYVVTYKTKHGGADYCFSNVFEISGVPSTSPFGIFGTHIPVPKNGDSGAWVCCPSGAGVALCGMLFAVDHGRGYACFTDEMKSWASGKSLTLDVL